MSLQNSISRSSLDSIPASFATVSVGTPNDSLEQKLEAISNAGFSAIELGFPDLLSFASSYHSQEIKENDYDNLCRASEGVKKLCQKHNLRIMMLQPFSNFEGWPKGSKEREDAIFRARGWIRIMQAIGTDMLQVGSSDSPKNEISTSVDDIVADLRELADMLAEHGFKLAYENWCWSNHAPTWKDVWTIVQAVDRPNIGLCLDTFQTAAYEYGDPTTSNGLLSSQTVNQSFASSLQELTASIPASKIYLLQISDAYRLPTPFTPDDDALGIGTGREANGQGGLKARGRWSMRFRPYPYNGGYLPVADVARAVLQTGFRGWFSTEVFDAGPQGEGFTKSRDFGKFCEGAMENYGRLLDECVGS